MNHLSPILHDEARLDLLQTLRRRFEKNPLRHQHIEWSDVQSKLERHPEKLWSLAEMENSGGEPDVVKYDSLNDEYHFYDCSKESPKGRRSICYDREGLESRKDYPPGNTAVDMANDMGIELLDENQYRYLQELEDFDLKTSSWIATPNAIRQLGGALFGDKRYNHVFFYHNGAQSYYAARGFRACVKV